MSVSIDMRRLNSVFESPRGPGMKRKLNTGFVIDQDSGNEEK